MVSSKMPHTVPGNGLEALSRCSFPCPSSSSLFLVLPLSLPFFRPDLVVDLDLLVSRPLLGGLAGRITSAEKVAWGDSYLSHGMGPESLKFLPLNRERNNATEEGVVRGGRRCGSGGLV
jgi:hypothetical protein